MINLFRMNDLDVHDIVRLFCCPPWPPRIVSKLAFLPPQPSYKFIHGAHQSSDNDSSSSSKYEIEFFENAEWQYTNNEKSRIEGFYTRTSKGNRIACIFVKCAATATASLNARFTVLFSHGNAIDLGQMSSFYVRFAAKLNCNVFSYDYSGYGVSGGQPSEKNVYADINAAWHCLRCYYAIDPDKIILYGQSIGTVPTIDLASKFHVAAVVLHSPLTSGLRVAFPLIKRTWFFDSFPSIKKVPKIKSPILIIHGKDDQVIDVSHGLAMFEKCQKPVEPLFIDRAGHNDVELYTQYWDRLQKFLFLELLLLLTE